MDKKRFFIKTLWHVFLYAVEVLGISIILARISAAVWAVQDGYEMLERIMTAYVIYEIAVFTFLTNQNDIEVDSALAYGTYLKSILLYFETNDSVLKREILEKRQRQLDIGTLNTPDNYKRYEQSLQWLEEGNKTRVQYELIRCEHHKEMVTLQWRFSFLLRRFK